MEDGTGMTAIDGVGAQQRYHQLDAARALFMLLGIPFHAALAYAGGHWLVMSGTVDPVLATIPPVLSVFRMPGFFLIAGFFAAMLLQRRRRAAWLKGRLERLGIPLLFGVATIVPLQMLLLRHAPAAVVDVPRAAGPAFLSHLWFLPTLLWLCLLLALGWSAIVRLPDPAASPRWITTGLAVLVAGYELVLRVIESVTGQDFALAGGVIDFAAVLTYAPFFAFGAWLRLAPALFARFQQFDPAVLLGGAGAALLNAALWQATTRPLIAIDILAEAVAAVCLTQAILALLGQFVTRASAPVDRMVDASFTIYLLHHPIVVALAIAFTFVPWPPLVEWAAICAIALGLSYGAHRLVRRSALLLWLMNGVARAKARRGVAAPRPAPLEAG